MNIVHTVDASQSGLRLDVILKELAAISRQAAQKAIKTGNCLIDGAAVSKADYKVKPGEKISLTLEEKTTELQAEEGGADIVWEDEYLAVCQKPAGLTVHPCPSARSNTLVQHLLVRYPQLNRQGGWRPGIAHRLDKDTSGLLLIALTEETRLALTELFARRKVHKEYLCLVKGCPPVDGRIDKPIGRNSGNRTKMAIVEEKRGGKAAGTIWKRLAHFPQRDFSLLQVRILTGRTHQIRVHMADAGYPLLGDVVYAPKAVAAMAKRQMLHAARLAFSHPFTGKELDFYLSPPEDFMECIVTNARETPLIVVTGCPGSGKSAFCKFLAGTDLPYISADAIVEELYAKSGPVSHWLARNASSDILNEDGEVEKKRLLAALERDASLKRNFEAYVHQLVYDQIIAFCQKNQNGHYLAIIAEIPLYFECGAQKRFATPPLTIGVACKSGLRKKRLKNTRNWNDEKIAVIDAWQWPETRKMQACQLVVNNEGSENQLKEQAQAIRQLLGELPAAKEQGLRQKICKLWDKPGEKLKASSAQ